MSIPSPGPGVRYMSEEDSFVSCQRRPANTLAKSIDWKQGLIIAMGVPILILPSLYDISGSVWAFSIVIWTVSVIQGFLQNMAIGEMAAALEVPGIGACAQRVFNNPQKYKGKKYNLGKFVGAFCAWSYWFTWTPVIPIFTITAGAYLQEFIEPLAGVNSTLLNLVLGFIIFSLITFFGSKGLSGGAKFGLVLAAITIIPLVVVVLIPFFNGAFDTQVIVDEFLPPEWGWSIHDIFVMFGAFAVAQWSACAWESTATYGAEYKDPGKNLPKALISCGLVCLVIYFLVSLSVFGTLGMEGINEYGYATLVPIAIIDFGDVGSWIALILLVAGMVMLIQTAFLGSSRTLHCMSQHGNMPKFISHTNKNDAPIYAMLFQFVVGMCMIPLGSPAMILAASSFGFCIALGFAMMSFIKFRREDRWKEIREKREYIAPKGWYYVAWAIMIYQFFILIPGCAVYSIAIYGYQSVILGAIILLVYVPIWFILHRNDDPNDTTEEDYSSG